MQKFEVLDTIPESYKTHFIADGANGNCFITSTGEVYKEFKNEFPYERELELLSDIQSPFFAFPKKLVYLRSKKPDTLKGYTMDFVDGKVFSSLDRKTKIERLLQASKDIEEEILKLTKYYGVLLYDLNDGNIFIRPNVSFKVLDTDYYEFTPYNEQYENMKTNMRIWNEYLLYSLGGYMEAFHSDRINLHFEIAITSGKYKSSNILEELLEEIRKQSSSDITTLEDYFEGIKLIKRRNDI